MATSANYSVMTGFRLWVIEARWCAICLLFGDHRRGDPHHVHAKGIGGKRPPEFDHGNLVCLCRYHHGLGESPGWSWKRVEGHYGTSLVRVAAETWAEWEALPQGTRDEYNRRAEGDHGLEH